MNYKQGDKATCSQCNSPIVFIDPYWDHEGDMQPKHPATPLETVHLDVPTHTRLRLAQAAYDLTRFLLTLTKMHNLSIAELVCTLLSAAYDFQKQEVHKHDR